jgi:hypothetical protein
VGPKHAAETRLIKGFFSDSLTPTLAKERGMQPALLIDVDVDLYVSCVQCMEWMVQQVGVWPRRTACCAASRVACAVAACRHGGLHRGLLSGLLTPTTAHLCAIGGLRRGLLAPTTARLCARAQGLLVAGTIVYYDDVSIVKAEGGGELRAHDELTAKYNIQWRKLHDSCWEVLEVGGAS